MADRAARMKERHRFMAELRGLSDERLRQRARFALRTRDRRLILRELRRRLGPNQ